MNCFLIVFLLFCFCFENFLLTISTTQNHDPFQCLNVTTVHSPEICNRWHLYVFGMITRDGIEEFSKIIDRISVSCVKTERNVTEAEKGKITFLVPYDNNTYEQNFGDSVRPDVIIKFLDNVTDDTPVTNDFFNEQVVDRIDKDESGKAKALYMITNLDCEDDLLQKFKNIDIGGLVDAIVKLNVPIRTIMINDDPNYTTCPMSMMRKLSGGLFDFKFQSDLCFDRDLGLCSANITCDRAPSTTTLGGRNTNSGAWGYIAGAIGGIVLFTFFCFGLRFASYRFCPQWTLKKMREDIWKLRDYLPEEDRDRLDAMKVASIRNDYMTHVEQRSSSEVERVRDKWEIEPSSLITTSIKLGSGAYAVVYKGLLNEPPPFSTIHSRLKTCSMYSVGSVTRVAVKMCHPHASKEDKAEMIREIDFMIGLEVHPHLLCFLGCSKDPEKPMILTELCEKGDLLSLLRNSKEDQNGLTQKELLPIAWQISDALVYLSGKNIIHRDVAVRNVLITGQNLAKLADFGLCRESTSLFYSSRGGRLPIKWMAPESLKTAEFTEKTDVWSFGVLLWELYTFGNSPLVSVDAEDVYEHLKSDNRLELPGDCPEQIKELTTQCWEFDPSNRPNFEEIRSVLYTFLEIGSSHYGYLDFRRNYHVQEINEQEEFENEVEEVNEQKGVEEEEEEEESEEREMGGPGGPGVTEEEKQEVEDEQSKDQREEEVEEEEQPQKVEESEERREERKMGGPGGTGGTGGPEEKRQEVEGESGEDQREEEVEDKEKDKNSKKEESNKRPID